MANLRQAARGRDCTIRTPVCSFATEQTVLAHVRMSGISGMGIKAPDIFGAWSCAPCHVLVDAGQYGGVSLSPDERDLYLLRGMVRTQAILLKEGLIKC
jgi:hypothetical protein